MADLFTVPPLPQTSYSVDLYNADSLVCTADSCVFGLSLWLW